MFSTLQNSNKAVKELTPKEGTKQTENFHLIRDEQGNSAGTDSALSFLHKEIPACIPEFVLAAEEKEEMKKRKRNEKLAFI